MKAITQKTFVPVTLTLESQEEIDAVWSLLNHNSLTRTLQLDGCKIIGELPELKEQINRNNTSIMHTSLNNLILKGRLL